MVTMASAGATDRFGSEAGFVAVRLAVKVSDSSTIPS